MSRPNAVAWPAAVPEHSKTIHSVAGRPESSAKPAIALRMARPVHLPRIEGQGRAMARHGRELGGIDIDGDDGGAERARDLHGIAADAADANDDGQAPRRDAGLGGRLVGRGDGVRNHRDIGEREARRREPRFVTGHSP